GPGPIEACPHDSRSRLYTAEGGRLSVRSIQFRLTIWYLVVTVLGLSLFAISMWIVLQHQLAADIDERLRDQGRGLQAVLDGMRHGSAEAKVREEVSEFARELPDHGLVQLRDDSGHLIFSDPVETQKLQFVTLSGYQTINIDQ